ncbi:hypothetical protein C8F04DRAFT_1200942 [Mycena alexandri]|uniref:Uncharacterized protein n=1 Tax=Mycena alexandri TaxID=1745969 RepID=A0AAD6WLS2_9AGAR|nr:hypothetical protein C8F04DRAFT_1200942 [Mycena alexandri]
MCYKFFDELDSIVKARGSGNNDGEGTGDRVLDRILTEVDSMNTRRTAYLSARQIDSAPVSRSSRPAHLHPPPRRGLTPGHLRACLKKSPVSPKVNLNFAYSACGQGWRSARALRRTFRRTRERMARDEASGEDAMKVEEDAAVVQEEDVVPEITSTH